MAAEFNGVIRPDVRDSEPDWAPYLPPQAPEGSPNVVYIVWDDAGLAAFQFKAIAQAVIVGIGQGIVGVEAIVDTGQQAIAVGVGQGWETIVPVQRQPAVAIGQAHKAIHRSGEDIELEFIERC